MAGNPYMLTFGREPTQSISRAAQMAEIQESFLDDPATQQIFLITGIRGCGKTVFMTEAAKSLKEEGNWIVVELSPTEDMLSDLAAALASEDYLARIFRNEKINLSIFGIGLEVKNSVPISSIKTALSKMLESIKKHGKKVLICIDEVTVTPSMISFASTYQILVRQDLPVFLLMTGLYDNINSLQNHKNLTFLYRAPKIALNPLNLTAVSNNYRKAIGVPEKDADEMAELTRGYSFAFQVLGYYTFRNKGKYRDALDEYRQYLEDYVYDKIWSELSEKDREFARGIASVPSGRAKEIKEFLGLKDNEYSPYRDRLVKTGILDGRQHGVVRFILPLFEEYVLKR